MEERMPEGKVTDGKRADWDSQTIRRRPLEEMSAFFNDRADRYNRVHLENIDGGIESKQIIASYCCS